MKDTTQTMSTHMEVENYRSMAACQPASDVGTLEVVQGHHTAPAFIQVFLVTLKWRTLYDKNFNLSCPCC